MFLCCQSQGNNRCTFQFGISPLSCCFCIAYIHYTICVIYFLLSTLYWTTLFLCLKQFIQIIYFIIVSVFYVTRKRIDDHMNKNPELSNLQPLDLDPCDAFLRKCLFEEVRQRFAVILYAIIFFNKKQLTNNS